MWTTVTAVLCLIQIARALPQTVTSPEPSAPSLTVSTAVASPTFPLSDTLPSQVPLPPKQGWCPSEIFCAGELLQTINLAELYTDQKTFVDKPTNKTSQEVLDDFRRILNSTNVTEGDIANFVDSDFRGEGLELEPVELTSFNAEPAFLDNITDPLVKAWSEIVHGYWTQLIRATNHSAICPSGSNNGPCESTLIPLNHSFVVPGGRFREQYYWDSFWIVEGLIKSELLDIVNATLQNFMDELDTIGFIPNGGRIYYLDRSQPPLFIAMLAAYVEASNDTRILDRALPLAEKELSWWATNRSVKVTSPYTGAKRTVYRFAVNNTAPRPESYLADYQTANNPGLSPPLNESERSDLYAELASGAETGWDYTVRWTREPFAGGTNDTDATLRTLNVRGTIPVDLNSIIYKAHLLLAGFYNNQSRSATAANHTRAAQGLRESILDLSWDSSKLAFYDFNLTANARGTVFSAAHFYPLWAGIIPDELLANETAAFGAFSAVNMVLSRYNGTFPSTLHETGLQWDAPNAWPPHQYIILEALRNLPSNLTSSPLPSPPEGQSTYALIPSGQLDVAEDQLPGQLVIGSGNATKTGASADINIVNGTIFNGGNSTDGEGWSARLQRELANRYIAGALCSWHATGGEVPNILPRLPQSELELTHSVNNTGNMFEKFAMNDIDSAGRGGEYTVQAGFGWTNGVVLWIADLYGDQLVAPFCPNITEEAAGPPSDNTSSSGAMILVLPPVFSVAGFVVVILFGTLL